MSKVITLQIETAGPLDLNEGEEIDLGVGVGTVSIGAEDEGHGFGLSTWTDVAISVVEGAAAKAVVEGLRFAVKKVIVGVRRNQESEPEDGSDASLEIALEAEPDEDASESDHS